MFRELSHRGGDGLPYVEDKIQEEISLISPGVLVSAMELLLKNEGSFLCPWPSPLGVGVYQF